MLLLAFFNCRLLLCCFCYHQHILYHYLTCYFIDVHLQMHKSTGNGNHSLRSSHTSGPSSPNTCGTAQPRSSTMSRGSSSSATVVGRTPNQNGNLEMADQPISFRMNDGPGAVPRR